MSPQEAVAVEVAVGLDVHQIEDRRSHVEEVRPLDVEVGVGRVQKRVLELMHPVAGTLGEDSLLAAEAGLQVEAVRGDDHEVGRASCRERVFSSV